MSFETYQQAKQIIVTNREKGFFIGHCSDDLIALAQEVLGLKFSASYLDFLKSFGAGNFGAQEIYGIISDDFENSSVPDAIWFTLTERNEINLPKNLLVIYDTGSDELFCLDFNRVNEMNEPQVVSFVPGIDIDNQSYEVIANDFGDFLLDLVEKEI